MKRVWISSYKWKQMCKRIDRCEKRIIMQQEIMDQKIIEMAKKILRRPNELSKEIESQEAIEQFVNEFIQS